MSHLLVTVAVIGCIIVCTVMPFLPGRYDSLAVPLAAMAQFLGVTGLLLVPIGAAWWVSERWSHSGIRHAFGVAAVMILAVVCALVSLVGAIQGGLTVGICAFALSVYSISRLVPRLERLKIETPAPTTRVPVYLVVVPLAVVSLQMMLAAPITEFGRSRAIRNSAPLIAEIERYHESHGKYPASLLALWQDYGPSMIGISEYRYEASGEAYNLAFEQFSFRLGTREIVMYNPRDEHVVTSHALDLLQRTPAEVELRRGYYAVHDAPHAHWKYFWFD